MKWNYQRSQAYRIAELLLAFVILPPGTAWAQSAELTRRPRQVLVSVPDRKLAVLEDGRVIRIFPVSVGAAVSPSPIGQFRIVNRVANPTYYHPGTVIPAGAGNPIGPRWIGLSQKGFGLHGTSDPGSIGKAASHGCIRLRNSDVKQLFAMVNVGDTVEIRGERDDQTVRLFGGFASDVSLAQAHAVMPAAMSATGGQ